jgi:hypothetical protein
MYIADYTTTKIGQVQRHKCILFGVTVAGHSERGSGPRVFINDRRELLRPTSGILDLLLEVLFFRSLLRNQLDRQLVHFTGESERRLVVLVVHARAGIHPDIEGLVDRLDERNGVRDRLAGNSVAVHRQDAGATETRACGQPRVIT